MFSSTLCWLDDNDGQHHVTCVAYMVFFCNHGPVSFYSTPRELHTWKEVSTHIFVSSIQALCVNALLSFLSIQAHLIPVTAFYSLCIEGQIS